VAQIIRRHFFNLLLLPGILCAWHTETPMQRKIASAALFLSCGMTWQAFAGAFQVKTSHGTWAKKENQRPLSLTRQLLKMDLSTSYTRGLTGFNSTGLNGCDPLLDASCADQSSSFLLFVPNGDVTAGSLAHNFVDTEVTRLDIGYGLTENWTVGFAFPFVTARENYQATPGNEDIVAQDIILGAVPTRKTNALGDMNFLIQYQFLRTFEGPMRALTGRINMKVPTGNESPGIPNKSVVGDDPETPEIEAQHSEDTRALLTGTGTTDAEISVAYKQEIGNAIAITVDAGYVVRFPTISGFLFDDAGVQFVDGLKGSARLDLGDQVFGKVKLTVSPTEQWFATLDAKITRWGASRIARPVLLRGQDVATGEQTTEEQDIFVGGHYLDVPDSAGFLVTTTPRFAYQPTEWLEVGLSTDLHLTGKNTNYVHGNNVTDQFDDNGNEIDRPFGLLGEEENNFFANEALGVPLGPIILGTTRLTLTFKY
jgi:hypothetical protein